MIMQFKIFFQLCYYRALNHKLPEEYLRPFKHSVMDRFCKTSGTFSVTDHMSHVTPFNSFMTEAFII